MSCAVSFRCRGCKRSWEMTHEYDDRDVAIEKAKALEARHKAECPVYDADPPLYYLEIP